MKAINCFYFLTIISLLFLFSYQAEDMCPSGMRKLYVDDTSMTQYGAARAFLAAVAFFQFPGSLFFKRKVLIEPRFEVHLKASTDYIDIIEKAREQKIYGFTIVISGYKNTISGLEARSYVGQESYDNYVFEDIGYNNFVNSLIIEFDFEKNTYDPDSDSFSVRYCEKSCETSSDNTAIYSSRLNSQRFDANKANNWDFRLIYDTKKLYLYSGPNEVLYSTYMDLEEKLGTNIAFVGFTGFMESNRREISLIGSFICEDNYVISKMPGNFLVNNQLFDTAGYEAGTPINYLFSFINDKDQLVPHTYGYDIWNYTFTLQTDCGEVSYSMNKDTNYTLILTMKACTKAGTHSLHINEEKKGDAPERYYIVHPGPLKKIILIGHDGIIGNVPTKYQSDKIYLSYGDSPLGDFIIKDNLKLVLDFKMTDQYDNEVQVSSPTNLFTLKKITEGSEPTIVTTLMLTYNVQGVDNHYQMNLDVLKVGTYQIETDGYMEPLRFSVVPGEASPSSSFCTLKDYSSVPNLFQNKDVYYNCYLRDDKGNEIDINTFVSNSIYEFSCKNQRIKPSYKDYSTTVEGKGNYYSCLYKTSDTGIFEINGYLTKKGTTQSYQITPKINQFSVRGSSDSLILKKVLNQYDKKWIDITNAEISYAYGENDRLTALDLAESDGETLISSYGNYPSDFDISKITAELYTYHDWNYKFTLQPKKITIDGKEYIGLFPQDSDKDKSPLIKKSSFEYYIKVKYNNDEKIIKVVYILNIGSYQTCFHDYDVSKVNLEQDWSLELLIGSERKIAKIELKTTDYYLYNYKKTVKYILNPQSNAIQFRIVPLSIDGTYDVYATAYDTYYGNVETYVENDLIRTTYISAQPSLACTLEFLHEEDFEQVEGPGDYREHYYDYKGEFIDGNLQFYFKIRDKFGNEIIKDNYFDTYADIYSLQFGNNDYKLMTVKFDKPVEGTENGAFNFRDDLPFETRKFTWVFFMRDSSCNNKYYIMYDGMRGGSSVDSEKSYYTLLKNEIKLKEYAYVDVFLKDTNDQFLGLQSGKLDELRNKVTVSAKNDDSNESINLEFDSITSNYAIRFKKAITVAGTYTVTAKYDNNSLKCTSSNKLKVIDNEFSLEHSLLKLILDKVIDMDPNVRVTIDNTFQEPVYKLYFYSSIGLKINYDGKTTFTCKMTGEDTDMDLEVSYDNPEYVQFTHKAADLVDNGAFKTLSKGNYNLIIKTSAGKEKTYLLFLNGDGSDDSSNKDDYDISKTYVYPTHIDGIAGKTYSINVELRASDGLRWKKRVDTSKFKLDNSYNLDESNFNYKVELGYKNGQAIIYVTQKKATEENKYNYLTIYYEDNKVPQQVTLNIICGDFAKLIYVSGPTAGNVINPPIISFKPVDSYGNLYTHLFTNPTSQEYLNGLTIGKSTDDEPVPLTSNNYLEDNLLKVQYKSTISTNVKVTSPYFEESYEYRIWSGPIDPETSYAELITSGTNKVGSKYTIIIYPKDKYGNEIDTLNEDDMNNFNTFYQISGSTNKTDVNECQLLKEGEAEKLRKLTEVLSDYKNIECHTSITKTGSMGFHVDYIEDEIECRNCEFFVISDSISFKNTKTLYKNQNYYLDTGKLNEVQGKVEPIFELTFFDEYGNQIGSSIVQKLDIKPTFEGADIKLCISNSNEKKIINLCPATNGDDNINKWQYITNGENYKLILETNDQTLSNLAYRIKITGGSEGSSDPEDFKQTTFIPEILEVVAGVEGETVMQINTEKGERKNYWYPIPSDKIKVEFDEDKDTCSYKVEYGDLPGRYAIKITCTKTNNNNGFYVTVDSNKIDKRVKVIVKSGPAYYLEVEESDKFTISSDKYTWKNNPTNDDTISFLFKLKDKYLNYITTSVIGKEEITIASETFGSSDQYYNLEFKDENTDYLFTDKIETVITKHVWNIICIASQRKYSFIYTKIAGKPDPSQSSWTIDKTSYIIKETSTVLVTLRDRLGVNIGTIEGKLLEEVQNLKVVATDSGNKEYNYKYNSITDDANIKYLNEFNIVDKYLVSVSYNGAQIGDKVEITVSYDVISLKDSKLYYDLFNGKEILMLTSEQTNINNKDNYVFYKFYLYNAQGKNISEYDKGIETSCKMTFGDSEWNLDVEKKDNHLVLTYEEGFETQFHKLPLGLYSLDITIDNKVIQYPLYLLGEKGVSPDTNYDLTKTYVNPTYIDGIAGEQYEIDIEFRAKDNLRWNYEINLDYFEISNSYGLDDSKLKIIKQQGEKTGQMKLLVIQYVTSTETDNVLSFTYKTKDIPTTVTLHIKCSDLLTLEYHSGAIDGTVVNPSIVKFIPKDKYGNLYTDLFDDTLYPKEKLETLTKGVSIEGHSLTTNNYVSEGKYLNVQYGCKSVTTIELTCTNKLNPNTYRYKLWSGPIDPDQSYAEIEKTEGVVAGDISKLTIHPKDIYGNDVTNATEYELENFEVNYEVNKEDKEDISNSCEYYEVSELDKYKCQANVTKAGPIEFTVDYIDKPIKCRNCQFIINPDKIDFSKTKVYNKNENKEMSRTELNTLPVKVLPNFELYFFDRFMNAIVDQKEVEALKVATEFVVTDVKLCVEGNGLTKLSYVCKSQDDDENEEKWGYLPNGNNYNLIAINTETEERIPFPVELTGGYSGGSPDKIDPSKTKLYPTEKTLVAGEEGTVGLELRTKDDERKNYWYKEPEKHITVEFPESIKTCTYSLSEGDNPGQYDITFNCTKKHDGFEVTVYVEKTKVPTPILISVVPAAPSKSKLFYMDNTEITKSDLGKVSVEDKFQMINKLYDKYDNQITNIEFELSTLQIKMNPTTTPKSHTWSAEPVAQKNGDIIITLKSTFASLHTVTGLYFPLEEYTLLFTHGEPVAENSISDVNKVEAYIDEEVKMCIIAYDKYNNYIDANELKDKNPFIAKYSNEKENTKVELTNFAVELYNSKNALCYPKSFTLTGITTMLGYINDKQIKFDKYRVNIKTKDLSFLNSYVLRFESSKNAFELLKDGAQEKNNIEKPIYRLYPRDKYGNDVEVIPTEILNKFTCNFKSQTKQEEYEMVLNNRDAENAEYAEFVVNNTIEDDENSSNRYKDLSKGFFNLTFADEKDKLVYNVSLTGDGKGGSTAPEDLTKTVIIDQNLKYIAGQSGYMVIEIRTVDGDRKNSWGFSFSVESCDKTDETFKFTQEKAGERGVFLITVTTERANTYPILERCPLKISINNILVEHLNPEQEVSPDEVVLTEILKKYYKEGNDTYLLDGNADNDYVFEVRSFDKFGNLAETKQEEVGIKISLITEEITTVTSETNKETGFRKYTVVAHKAGIYTISTDKIGPLGLYLPKESKFIIKPGAIDLSKTIVKEKESPIRAGNKPAVFIEAFDKYGNSLDYKDYIDKFIPTFIDPKNKEHESDGEYDEDVRKSCYTSLTPVTVIGNVKVSVTYENEELDTSKVIIVVIPEDPDPKNSILTRETSKGVFTTYKNGESFTVDVKEYLELNVTLYDKYNNYISNIPADAKIVNPIMSGNHMTEINFTVTLNDGYFGLDFNDNSDYIYIYQHLVGGTYDLNYIVKTNLDQASFKYNIIIPGGDGKHGNGPYVIEKCVLTPKNTSFVAGNYEEFTLELRTEEGLLYNDDIDIDSDLEIKIQKEDPSFKATVTKAGSDYGIYTIQIYSEKKGDYTMNVNLADPATDYKEKKDVGPAYYHVYPDKVPYKTYTIFKELPPQKPETVKNDQEISMKFILADKFNNTFEYRKDIVDDNYLTLLNYEEPISFTSLKLVDGKEEYRITLYPRYPPKEMTMNVLYNDGENRVFCFEENVNVTITSELDIYLTKIVSKNKDKITVGETLDMWLYTFDKKGECLDDDDYSSRYEIIVTGPMDSPNQETKTYKVRKSQNKENIQCNNEYQIITDPEKDVYKFAGDYVIRVNADHTLIGRYDQVCYPLGYSLDGFLLEYSFDPNSISILDTVSFTISGTDQYGNKVDEPLYDDITIAFSKDEKNTDFESKKSEIIVGKLQYDVAIREIGPHQLHIYYKGEEVLTVNHGENLPIFNILPGPCRTENNDNFDLSPLDDVQRNDNAYFTFQCYDIYNNTITHGGEQFTVTGKVMTSSNENEVEDIEIVDNKDGSYTVKFIPEYEGTYLFNILVGNEKYGEEIKWTLSKKECTGDTSILCPNENRCVGNILDCISPSDKCKEDETKPFYCLVNGNYTCTKSQTDCDCPTGYIKCNIMKYCVPNDRKDMCPEFTINNKKCQKLDTSLVMYYDGVCRKKGYHGPAQRVCPIGKVLCADLSCKDNYYLCPNTTVLPSNKYRCISQEIVSDPETCPSTFTCPNEDDVACPNGVCVSNEIKCDPVTKCTGDASYLCQNNMCSFSYEDCTQAVSCGRKKSLCSDSICREEC